MPKIYERNCNNCGKHYKGQGQYFCGLFCTYSSKQRNDKISKKIKGQHHSLNTEFQKGQISWNKGKHLSQKVKNKISIAHKGKKLSKKHKRKISKIMKGNKYGSGNLGCKHTEATKRKQSEAMKGKKVRGTGWHHTKKTRKKISKAHKGEKSHLWKGGITLENKKIRKGVEAKLWREAVFARDNWTCQKCEQKGGKLKVHHILNFAQYEKLRFMIDNGITFCEKCHNKFHKIYGRKNNTKKQLLEFLE